MSSTHDFSGKRVALTGRFTHTKDKFAKELEALGATTTKSVSSKTDYLIEGSGTWGGMRTKALKLGAVVLTEAEARAVIDGEQIEVALPGEGGAQSLDELLGEARSLLARPPSLEVWRALAVLLEHCTLEHLDALSSYVGSHTHSWSEAQTHDLTGCVLDENTLQTSTKEWDPWQQKTRDRFYRGELRVMPEKWSAELLQGLGSAKSELAHALHIGANSKSTSKALSSPHLTHIERLSLWPYPKPTTQLLKTLCQLEWLPRVTHLAISVMTLQAAEYLVEHTSPMGLELLDLSKVQHHDRAHVRDTLETLIRVPLFETVHTLILRGSDDHTRHLARNRRKFQCMSALRTVHLNDLWRWNARRLHYLRENGLFNGVDTLELGEITFSAQGLSDWREIFDQSLPESIEHVDMTHVEFYPEQPAPELLDEIFDAMAQSTMLEHVKQLTLRMRIVTQDRIVAIFEAHRPDLALTLLHHT